MKPILLSFVVLCALFASALAAATPEGIAKEKADKLNAERAEKLKAEAGDFDLTLQYFGKQDEAKPFCWLTLSVKPMVRSAVYKHQVDAHIDEADARKLIDVLAQSGVLGRARDARVEEALRR